MTKLTLTIRDIAKLTTWKEVKQAIRYHYPKDRNNYETLFDRLPFMRKNHRIPATWTLEIYGGIDITTEYAPKYLEQIRKGDEELYYSIHIKDTATEFGSWSMSFQPWVKMANVPIDPETLRHYTFQDIIAHFIWEITFYGNEKQMRAHGRELRRRVKDVKSGNAKIVPYNPQ